MDNDFDISSVSKQGIAGDRGYGGIGYVALPTDVDSNVFIKQCLALNTITMVTENFEFINNVPVDIEKMQYLRFPTDSSLVGSTLVWINIPKYNLPVVIAVLNSKDQISNISELNSHTTSRRNPIDNSVGVSTKILGDKGKYMLTTEGEKNGESVVSIKVYNNANQGLHQTYVQGIKETEVEDTIRYKAVNAFEITIQDPASTDIQTVIKYVRNSGFTLNDQWGNQFLSTKLGFSIKNNNESVYAILSDLLTAIQNMTMPTPDGDTGFPNNLSDFITLGVRLKNILQ